MPDFTGFVVRVKLCDSAPPRQVSFEVVEFFQDNDGHRIQVAPVVGWTETAGGHSAAGHLASMTTKSLKLQALNVLLPDDAEITGELQDWQGIRRTLSENGLDLPLKRLRSLPIRVEVDSDLREKIEE